MILFVPNVLSHSALVKQKPKNSFVATFGCLNNILYLKNKKSISRYIWIKTYFSFVKIFFMIFLFFFSLRVFKLVLLYQFFTIAQTFSLFLPHKFDFLRWKKEWLCVCVRERAYVWALFYCFSLKVTPFSFFRTYTHCFFFFLPHYG